MAPSRALTIAGCHSKSGVRSSANAPSTSRRLEASTTRLTTSTLSRAITSEYRAAHTRVESGVPVLQARYPQLRKVDKKWVRPGAAGPTDAQVMRLGRREAVAAHHLTQCGQIRRTAGRSGKHLAALAEGGGAEDAWGRGREGLRIDAAAG